VLVVPAILAGRYELRELLGRGGMGEVYEGWDRRLNRLVAIKLLRSELANDPQLLQRFEAEARAAAMLSHPNVVEVFDSGNEAGTPYIVMERLPGQTLADELLMGPLEPPRVRTMLADILKALAAAHRRGLIHRDIKPSNVLFTETGAFKVADFGIAKTAQAALTQTGQLLGTLAYLSPEQLDGSPATPQSDLYSVGVVGYEALTGQRPFTGETPLGLIRAIAEGPRASVRQECPAADEELCGAIDRALKQAPAARFGSADEMLAALGSRAHAASSLPVAAPQAVTRVMERLGSGDTRRDRFRLRPVDVLRRRDWHIVAGVLAAVALLLVLFLPEDGRDSGAPRSSATAPAAAPDSPPPTSVLPEGVVAEAREVRDFNSILFRGSGRLVIEQTGSESLTVEAEREVLPLIGSEVAGGRLILGPRAGAVFRPGREVTYRLTLRRLDDLEASGSGTIEASRLDAARLDFVRSGSGDSILGGNADQLDVSISGSGNFDGSRLLSRRARVEISGSGVALVNVSRTLEARVSGSGSIKYIGNPTVTKATSGSGSVGED
jgi:serine/threonine protein kinase